MIGRLRQVAEGLGLPFGERRRTYNSRLAQELGLWAEAEGRGDAFHHAAFKAYFAEGKNLAEPSVLMELAQAAGLSRDGAGKVIRERTFSAAVDRDWAASRRMGITAVPTFVMGERRLVGAQPYEKLAELVEGRPSGAPEPLFVQPPKDSEDD